MSDLALLEDNKRTAGEFVDQDPTWLRDRLVRGHGHTLFRRVVPAFSQLLGKSPYRVECVLEHI
jgi:hypothetical protein